MEVEQFALMAADADAWGKVVYAPEGWYREDARAGNVLVAVGRTSCFSIAIQQKSDYFGQAVIGTGL